MTSPTFFTVIGDYKSIVADTTNDSDANPDLGVLTATVTFTPMINSGDVILATQASPRPTGFVPAPITGFIDTDGRLKLRAAANGDYDYTPVRLLANTPLLNLSTPLIYRVSFSNVTYDNRTGSINSFFISAPTEDIVVDLIQAGQVPGQNAVGITHLAPGAVRLEGTNLIFSFDSVDIPDPVSLEGLRGPTGATGPSASISVGSVSTGAAGSTATVANSGTTGAAVFDFSIPRGDTGATGPTGSAATIAVGTVSTGAAGSTASVTNTGNSGAAVFAFSVPKGDTGATGATGAAATISVGTVSTGSPGSSVTFTNTGSSGAAVFDISIPAGATGATGPTGPTGATGSAATISVGTVSTGSAGSTASVTNVGTANAAVFNITIPRGDTGSADPSTWYTIADRPAVVAEGATKAAARTAIDAEYTGNKGNANGYASLDSAGKVPYSQLPSSVMSYLGVWNASTNTPTLADGSGDQGDLYRVSVAATRNLGSGSISWGVGDYAIYNGSTWEKSDSTDAVASVNGYTGVVSLTKADVGLSAVDNTADTDKPISTAVSTALSGKEPTITAGSTGQYWTGSKTWATLNAAAVSGVEATANKGAAGGYAGLDGSSKVAIANLPTGTTSSTVCVGNDSRLSDARTPTAHTHAVADINASTTTALGVGSVELGHASDTTLTRSAAGVLAVEGVDLVKTTDSRLTNSRTPTAAGQVADLSIVAFGANTARATGTGDFPFGVKLQRAVTLTSVTYRAATADASGSLVVELRKNGSTVTGSSATIAAASQVAGGTATGTWSFAAGDIVTVYITAVGTTPGKGCIADITGVTA